MTTDRAAAPTTHAAHRAGRGGPAPARRVAISRAIRSCARRRRPVYVSGRGERVGHLGRCAGAAAPADVGDDAARSRWPAWPRVDRVDELGLRRAAPAGGSGAGTAGRRSTASFSRLRLSVRVDRGGDEDRADAARLLVGAHQRVQRAQLRAGPARRRRAGWPGAARRAARCSPRGTRSYAVRGASTVRATTPCADRGPGRPASGAASRSRRR